MECLVKIPLGRCPSTAMLTSRRTSTTSSNAQNLEDVNMSYEPNEDDLNDFPHETSEFFNDDFISRVSPATVLPALDDDHITSTTQPVTFACNVEEVPIGEDNRDLVAKLQQITPEKMRKIHDIIEESADGGPFECDKEKRHSSETVCTEVQMLPSSSEAEGVALDGSCGSDEGQAKVVEKQPETTSVDEVPSSTCQSPEKENSCPGTLSHSIFKGLFYLSDSEEGDCQDALLSCETLAAEPSSSQGNDSGSKEQTVEPTSPPVGTETVGKSPQPVESTCIETVKSTSPLKEVETLASTTDTTQCYPVPATEQKESTLATTDHKDTRDTSGVTGDHPQRDRKPTGEKKEKRRKSHSPVDDARKKAKEERKRERKEKKKEKSKDHNSMESRRSRHASDDKKSSRSNEERIREKSKERSTNQNHEAKESTRSRHHSDKEKKSNSAANSPNKEQQDLRTPAQGEKGSQRLTVAEVVQSVRSRHPSGSNGSQQVRSLSRNSSVEKVDQLARSPQHQMSSPGRKTSSEKLDQAGRSPHAATGTNSSRHGVTSISHGVDQLVRSPQHQSSTLCRRTSSEKVDQAGRSPHSATGSSSRHNVTPHATTERLHPHTNSSQPHTSPHSRRSSTEIVDQIRRNHRSPTSTKDAHIPRQQPQQPRQASASLGTSDLEIWRKNSKILSERLKKCHTWLEAHTQESAERAFHKLKWTSILVDKAMIDEKIDGFTGRIKGFLHTPVPKKLLYGPDIRHTVSSKGFPLLLLKEISYKDYIAYQNRLKEIDTLTKEAEDSGWEHQEKLAEKIKQYEIILQRLCGWTPKKTGVFSKSREKYMSMKTNLEKWGAQVPQELRLNEGRMGWLKMKLKEIEYHERLFKECLAKSESSKPQEGEAKSTDVDANMVVCDMDVDEPNPNTPPKIKLPRPGEQTSASCSVPSVQSRVVGPTHHMPLPSFNPITPPLSMVNPQWHCTVPPPLIPTVPPPPLMSAPLVLPQVALSTAVQHPVATGPPPPPPPLPPSPQRVVGSPPLPPPLPSSPLKELNTSAPPPLPADPQNELNVAFPVALSLASQSEIQMSSLLLSPQKLATSPSELKAPLLSSPQKEPETPSPAPVNSTLPSETEASLPSIPQTEVETSSPASLCSTLTSEPKTPLTSGPQIELKTASAASLPSTSQSEPHASLPSTPEKELEMPSLDCQPSTTQDELNASPPPPPQTSTPQHELKRSQLTGLPSTPLQKSPPSPLLSPPAAPQNEDETQSPPYHTERVTTTVVNENMETVQLEDPSPSSIAEVNANLLTESEPAVEITTWVSHTEEVCTTSDVSLGLNVASFASSKLCDSSLGLSIASLSSAKLSDSSLGLSVANLSSPKRSYSSLGLSEASLSTSKVSSAEIPSPQKDSVLPSAACESSASTPASPTQLADECTSKNEARPSTPSASSPLARQMPGSEELGSLSLNEPAVSTLKPTTLPLTIVPDSGMDQALPDSPLSPEEVTVWSDPPDLEQPRQLPSPQSLLRTDVFETTSIETLQRILANCSAKVAEPDESPMTEVPSTLSLCPETENKSGDVPDPVIQGADTKEPEDTSPPYDPMDPTADSDDEATLEKDDHDKENPPELKAERLQKSLRSTGPTFKSEGAVDSANQQRVSYSSDIPSEAAVSTTQMGLGRVEMIPGLSPPPSPKDFIKKESDLDVVRPHASLWSSSFPSRASADIFDHGEVIPGLSPPHMPHHDYTLEPECDAKRLNTEDSGTKGREWQASDVGRRLNADGEISSSMRGVKRKSEEFSRDSRSPPPKRLRSPPLSYGRRCSRTPSPLPWNYRSRQRARPRSRSPVRRRSRSKSRPRQRRRSRSRSLPRTRSPTPTPVPNNEPLWLQLKKDIAKPKSHGDTDMRNVQNSSSLSTNFVQRHYQRQSSYSRQVVDSRGMAYDRCQYRDPQPRRQAPVHRDHDWDQREHGYIAQRERDLTYSAAWRRQSTYD